MAALGTGALAAADLGSARCEAYHRATEQTTYTVENNYKKEVLTLLQKFYGLQQISQPGNLAKGLSTSGKFDFEVGFHCRTSSGLGKQTLGGHKQNTVCTRTQKEGAVTPQET